MQPGAVLVIQSPSSPCRKPTACKEGGLRHWTHWNRLFRGTWYRVTLRVSVPPLEQWFAGTVTSPDLEQKHLPLMWGISIKSDLSQGLKELCDKGNIKTKRVIMCAPSVKRRLRICDKKTEGKEVKTVEMLQHEEKITNKTSSRHKGESREKHSEALIMATLGKTSNTANLAREKSLREKTSEGREQRS